MFLILISGSYEENWNTLLDKRAETATKISKMSLNNGKTNLNFDGIV